MLSRGTENGPAFDGIDTPKKFNEEISHWNEYNYVVVNDDLESCYNKILDIMLKEKKGESIKQNLEEIRKRVEKLTN